MLDTGGLVTVESATLPVATYSKFQPLSKVRSIAMHWQSWSFKIKIDPNQDFLDLTNPKAVLEMRLRHFACLSKGDIVAINYNNKIYELNVMETKPAAAVSIIECDMNVDFEVLFSSLFKAFFEVFFLNNFGLRHLQDTRSPGCPSLSQWRRKNQSWTFLRSLPNQS